MRLEWAGRAGIGIQGLDWRALSQFALVFNGYCIVQRDCMYGEKLWPSVFMQQPVGKKWVLSGVFMWQSRAEEETCTEPARWMPLLGVANALTAKIHSHLLPFLFLPLSFTSLFLSLIFVVERFISLFESQSYRDRGREGGSDLWFTDLLPRWLQGPTLDQREAGSFI